MSDKIFHACVVAYLIVGVVTFGRAYNNAPAAKTPYVSQQEISAANAGMAALMWPLYWSTVLWEKS